MDQLLNWMNPTHVQGLLVLVAGLMLAIWLILRGPRIIALLIVKYLRKRRIAWVALVAVILCTTMVLVVISVMGGWLRMFRLSFHGLSGDIQVRSYGLAGFPHYQKMIDRIEQLPEVGKGNAVPVVQTFGLITFDTNSLDKVQVLGYPIDKIGLVNDFPQSLFRQGIASREWAADELKRLLARAAASSDLTPDSNYVEYLRLKAVEPIRPASFALLREAFVPLQNLPPGVVFPKPTSAPATQPTEESSAFELLAEIHYDAGEHLLITRAVIGQTLLSKLLALSSDSGYQKAVRDLALKSRYDLVPYSIIGQDAGKRGIDVSTWPGVIVGSAVLGFHRDKEGHVPGRGGLYGHYLTLTVVGFDPGQRKLDLQNKSERNYWIVDDSRTRIYQYDSSSVYVDFERLQKDLGMDATPATSDQPATPARTTEIYVHVQPGFDLNATRDKIDAIVQNVMKEQSDGNPSPPLSVMTWEQSQKTYLNAIENEKVLITFLFGIISLVAVFLIFCIFYMIVVEKIRDIGIVKSVGATASQIAGIFLGYGLAIGLVGAGLGFLLGYLLVHNINEIHTWLGLKLHIVVWDPEVYQFDTIPNTMNPPEVAVVLIVAVVSAVLGALVPAIRAARLHPVEALRWE